MYAHIHETVVYHILHSWILYTALECSRGLLFFPNNNGNAVPRRSPQNDHWHAASAPDTVYEQPFDRAFKKTSNGDPDVFAVI
jgi:hypothetical protein